jgi:hypothetical protein
MDTEEAAGCPTPNSARSGNQIICAKGYCPRRSNAWQRTPRCLTVHASMTLTLLIQRKAIEISRERMKGEEHCVAVLSAFLIKQAQIRGRIDNYIKVGDSSEPQPYVHGPTVLMVSNQHDHSFAVPRLRDRRAMP